MAFQLEFRYRDNEPWIVVKDAFDIMATYLQPDKSLSAREAAEQMDKLTPSKRVLNDGEEAEESASFLLEFWEVVIATARQIPHDIQAQERFIDLVVGLHILPTLSSEVHHSLDLPYMLILTTFMGHWANVATIAVPSRSPQ